MADPFSLITSGTGFAITAAKFIAQLASVKDDTGRIIEQLQVITQDVVDAVNLRHEKKPFLSEAEKQRVDGVIEETKHAIMNIAKHLEPARRGVAKAGTVNVVDRFDWVCRRSAAVESYQHSLDASQRSLHGQILMLRIAHLTMPAQMPPPYNEISSIECEIIDDNTPKTPVDVKASSLLDEDCMSHHDPGATSKNADALLVDEQPLLLTTQVGDPLDTLDNIGASAPIELHPERLAYEEMQQLENCKRGKGEGRLHPEREMYEEMQRDSR